MGKRGSLLLGLQLLSCFVGFTTAEQSEYWVVPATEDCQTRENCSTLEEYAREGAFIQSNVVWIFKEGKHTLNGTIVAFSKVHNVTLTGTSACEQDINNCTIYCEGKQACMFLFVASTNITISNLRLIQNIPGQNPINVTVMRQHLPEEEPLCYRHRLGFPSSMTYVHFKNCLHDRGWVFVDVVHVTVSNVNVLGRNSYWAVVRPNGNYKIMKCQFYHLLLTQSSVSGDPQHYMTVVLRKPDTNESMLTFLIANSHFTSSDYMPSESLIDKWMKESKVKTTGLEVMAYPVVHIISDEPLNGWKANITIHKGHFCRCSPFQLTAIEDPGLSITLNNLNASTYIQGWWENHTNPFWGSAIRLFLTNCYTQKMDQIKNSTYSKMSPHQCAINDSVQLSNITVVSSEMSGYTSNKGCIILFEGRIAVSCPKGLRIVLQNNTFKNCSSSKFRSTVYGHQHLLDYHTPQNQTDRDPYRLVIDSNINEQNFRKDLLDRRCIVFERLPEENPLYVKRPGRHTYNQSCEENCIWQGVYYISGFQHHSRVLFTGNTISENRAQGLTLVGSVLEAEGLNHITSNNDHYGGGVAMHYDSQLWIRNGSKLDISNNYAFVRGGGIYNTDPCTVANLGTCPCFFEFIDSDGRPLTNTSVNTFTASVNLRKNQVRFSSSARATMIFNPNIDHCALQGSLEDSTKKELFQRVFGIPEKPTQDKISSIPRRICDCSGDDDGEGSNCTAWGELAYYPGQSLTLRVKLIGDMGISLESVLYIKLERSSYARDTKVYIPLLLHSTHVLKHGCKTLTIPPLPPKNDSKNYTWVLQLMVPLIPDRNHNIFLFQHVRTNPVMCPIAYRLDERRYKAVCKCFKLLTDKRVQCLLDKQLFVLPKSYWIGTEEEQEGNLLPKVLLSTGCTQVYCATATSGLKVSLSNPDIQCKHGRTGVLCGRCPNGKSSVLYSNACKTCTNWGILLLVPLLIAGPVLIALICCLNLTVSVGTLNGFLLYMNIITINSDVLTATEDSTDIRQALGYTSFIGLCVYDGMDAFASTMLAYLFPFYLLTLVGLICLLPKCKCVNMHKINRRIGPRITPVLATIILLSYTQLAESVIHSLLYVRLYITDGTDTTSRLVWMFDGSLEYFHSPKHIVLACLALLVLMCFLLPVTVVAIFGDLFRRFSRGPWYMNFLDSFHGAFRFRFGFWIGIRILLRIIFIFLKIFRPVDELFLVIAYTIMTLLFLQILIRPFRGIRVNECVSKKIKEKHFSDPLQRELVHSIDHSFLVNLIAVFVYLPHNEKNVTIVLIVSRVVAYVEFAGILVYHMMEYSPVGPFVFDTWFKLKQRYRRWRENRREATLARARQEADNTSGEDQFDLVLRASDCTDSDYEDESESDDDSMKETTRDNQQEGDKTKSKQASVEKDNWSAPVDMSLRSTLTAPLLTKIQENTQ